MDTGRRVAHRERGEHRVQVRVRAGVMVRVRVGVRVRVTVRVTVRIRARPPATASSFPVLQNPSDEDTTPLITTGDATAAGASRIPAGEKHVVLLHAEFQPTRPPLGPPKSKCMHKHIFRYCEGPIKRHQAYLSGQRTACRIAANCIDQAAYPSHDSLPMLTLSQKGFHHRKSFISGCHS